MPIVREEYVMKPWNLYVSFIHCQILYLKFPFLLTEVIYVFCMIVKTDSDYFLSRNLLIDFYKRDAMCLLRGTNWEFKYNLSNYPDQQMHNNI